MQTHKYTQTETHTHTNTHTRTHAHTHTRTRTHAQTYALPLATTLMLTLMCTLSLFHTQVYLLAQWQGVRLSRSLLYSKAVEDVLVFLREHAPEVLPLHVLV